jgi:hypothetical protein
VTATELCEILALSKLSVKILVYYVCISVTYIHSSYTYVSCLAIYVCVCMYAACHRAYFHCFACRFPHNAHECVSCKRLFARNFGMNCRLILWKHLWTRSCGILLTYWNVALRSSSVVTCDLINVCATVGAGTLWSCVWNIRNVHSCGHLEHCLFRKIKALVLLLIVAV